MSWGGVLGELDEERLDGARPESGDWLLLVGAANISTLKKSSNELKGIWDSTSMIEADVGSGEEMRNCWWWGDLQGPCVVGEGERKACVA